MQLGPDDYRRAAMERLEDARLLLDQDRWVAAVYLAGRAAEAFLRALLQPTTALNQSGHDLRDLMKQVAGLGVLNERDTDVLYEPLCEVAAIWHNNLRFTDEQRFLRHLKQMRKDRKIRGQPVEYWSKRLVEHAESVVNRAEVIWKRSRKN